MAPKPKPAIARFESKTRTTDAGCIEWTGDVSNVGYGRFWVGPEKSRKALAHRWAYEYHVGPIPQGLVIDHLCRNRLCVNPEHLEPVTPAENVRRGDGPALRSSIRWTATHCRNGHRFTPENTYVNGRDRTCLTCKKAQAREYYLANREATIARAAKWRTENPDRARQLARESARRYRQKRREMLSGHLQHDGVQV